MAALPPPRLVLRLHRQARPLHAGRAPPSKWCSTSSSCRMHRARWAPLAGLAGGPGSCGTAGRSRAGHAGQTAALLKRPDLPCHCVCDASRIFQGHIAPPPPVTYLPQALLYLFRVLLLAATGMLIWETVEKFTLSSEVSLPAARYAYQPFEYRHDHQSCWMGGES